MGYYSFYKIIKDVIRTLFGSRIFKYFIIVTIILILLFIFNKPSFGYTFENNNNTYNINIPDWVEANNLNYFICLYAFDNFRVCSFKLFIVDDTSIKFSQVSSSTNNILTSNGSYIIGSQRNSSGQTLSAFIDYTNNVLSGYTYSDYTNNKANSLTVYNMNDLIGQYNILKETTAPVYFNNSLYLDTTIINFTYPYLTPSQTDIQNLNFENLFVELGDYDLDENNLYLHALQITNSVPENNEVLYYYSDNVFALDKKSDYYHQLLDTTNYYFAIPKETINFGVDKSYLLVLTNKKSLEMNSIGLYEKDEQNGFFDVVLIDTSGIVTDSEVINNNLNNLNNNINNINNNLNPSSPINQNVTTENQEEIDSNLNFNNHNQQLENINSNFLSRLLNLVSGLADYDTSASYFDIPMPHSDKFLRLRSDVISAHLSQGLKNLISAMWFYMFTFYMYSYINKIYIALSTGKIIETFTSKGEVITNDML